LKLIPFGILIVIFYTLFGETQTERWFDIIRQSFIGTDPNEFSCMLSAFNSVALFNLYFNKSKIYKSVSMLTLITTLFIVTNLTISKAGFLTFIFTIFAFHAGMMLIHKKGKYYIYTLVISMSILLSIYFNLIDLKLMLKRFIPNYPYCLNTNSLEYITSGRSLTWIGGLKAFLQSPIIGHGGSKFSEIKAIYEAVGILRVAHNLYISALVQYGIIGLILLSLIIVKILRDAIALKRHHAWSFYLFPLFITLLSLLFAGLSLNWFKREILWFFIALNSGILSNFIKNSRIYGK